MAACEAVFEKAGRRGDLSRLQVYSAFLSALVQVGVDCPNFIIELGVVIPCEA